MFKDVLSVFFHTRQQTAFLRLISQWNKDNERACFSIMSLLAKKINKKNKQTTTTTKINNISSIGGLLKPLYIYIYIYIYSHLADAFIQSDLQMRAYIYIYIRNKKHIKYLFPYIYIP